MKYQDKIDEAVANARAVLARLDTAIVANDNLTSEIERALVIARSKPTNPVTIQGLGALHQMMTEALSNKAEIAGILTRIILLSPSEPLRDELRTGRQQFEESCLALSQQLNELGRLVFG